MPNNIVYFKLLFFLKTSTEILLSKVCNKSSIINYIFVTKEICFETVYLCKSSEKAFEIIFPMILHASCIISWKGISNDLI